MVDIRSVIKGYWHMSWKESKKAKWGAVVLPKNERRFYFNAWSPIWHKGRGPYFSIGLWYFGIYRGY